MKRDLKFRVWDGEKMRMPSPGLMLTFFADDKLVRWQLCERVGEARIADSQYEGALMQFTGLLDKNGQEIYEGDIVRRSDALPMQGKSTINIPFAPNQVYFAEGSFRLRRGLKSKKFPLRSSIIRQNGIEVIGNVHQHPQLLKGWNDGSTA